MPLFVKLMMGGWMTTFAMFGFCALKEPGKLLQILRRIAFWLLETSTVPVRGPEQSLQPERENAVS